MASGGGNPSRLSRSEPRRGIPTAYRISALTNRDDFPSLQEDRPNNWEFSDWRPAPFPSSRQKKGNQERAQEVERDQPRSLDSSPPGGETGRKSRTPSTFPRTRANFGGPSQRIALENLRQQLSFSDTEEPTNPEGERNNERYIPSRRDPSSLGLQNAAMARNETGVRASDSNRGGNTRNSNIAKEAVPDSNQVVGRLMQIRDYIKQASSMLERLQNSPEPSEQNRAGQLEQVVQSLKEQEQKYLDLLLKLSTAREEGLLAKQNFAEPANCRADTESEATTAELDVVSDTSEDTTDMNGWNLRPTIESKLGRHSDTELDEPVVATDRSHRSSHSNEGGELLAALGDWNSLNFATGLAPNDTLLEEPELDRKNQELDALRHQHDLLQKMLHQQEQLRALQGRQEMLVALQKEAEKKLAEERARNNAVSNLDLPLSEANTATTTTTQSETGDSAYGDNAEAVPQDLQELRQRLDYLKNLYDIKQEIKQEPLEVSTEINQLEEVRSVNTDDVSVTSAQRRHLQDKLQDLQEKKQQMDQLLQELHSLRSQKYTLNNELEIGSVTSSQAHISEGIRATAIANHTATEAEDVIELMETRNKSQKLKDVRGRLNQLRDLVQYYQTGREFIHSVENGEDQSLMPMLSDYDSMQANVKLEPRDSPQKDGMNDFLRRYKSGLAQPGSVGGALAMDLQTAMEEAQAASSAQDATETASQLSSNLGAWADDPEVQEKVRRLKAAKEKLHRLQDLISMVQQTPGMAEALPQDLAELAAGLEDEMASQTSEVDEDNGNALQRVMKEMATQAEMDNAEAEDYYENTMRQGREELEQLVAERDKLLTIQSELQKLHDALPTERGAQDSSQEPRLGEEPQRSPHGPQDTSVKTPVPEAQQVTFQEPLATVVPNDEVYNRMRQQRVLREELREKKKVLENMMRKDTPTRKQYSRNQDNQSDNVSYSNRSDTYGASVSEDVTMATWGGSTAGNLESIEEDENHSGDGRGEECDDGYPSDGIVQVEEEEEANIESDDRDTYTIEDEYVGRRQTRRSRSSEADGATGGSRKKKSGRGAPLVGQGRREGPRYPYNYWAPDNSDVLNNARSNRARARQHRRRQENFFWEDDIPEPSRRSRIQDDISSLRQQMAAIIQLMQGPDTSGAASFMQPTFNAGMLGSPGFLQPSFTSQVHQQQQQQQLLLALNQNCNQMLQQQQNMAQKLHRLESVVLPSTTDQSTTEEPVLTRERLLSRSSAQSPSVFHPSPAAIPNPNFTASPFTLRPNFPNFFGGESETGARLQRGGISSNREDSSMEDDSRNRNMNPRENANPFRIPEGAGVYHLRGNQKAANGMEKSDDVMIQTIQASDATGDVPRLDLQAALGGQRLQKSGSKKQQRTTPNKKAEGVIGQKFSTPSRAVAASRLASQQVAAPGGVSGLSYRPGLSAGISGTAYDVASISSALSSVAGVDSAMAAQGGGVRPKKRTSQTPQRQGEIDSRESDAPTEFSLFEALRETIYAEVATLISQNENRPHYLIELFRELQLLNSDYLRQRALYAVQELVSRHLTEEDVKDGQAGRNLEAAWKSMRGEECTPSESLITEEEEDYSKVGGQQARGGQLRREGSLQSSRFDYCEQAETTSSLSTPTSGSHLSPFAQESLGDTVIHLDKSHDYEHQPFTCDVVTYDPFYDSDAFLQLQALQKMKEYEARLAEVELLKQNKAQSGDEAAAAAAAAAGDAQSRDGVSVASSSAQDQASDGSVSDVPYPRIDTRQLDHQIKAIMTEIIPVLKEHMDDVCSQQLLQYIKRLVLSLTRQQDDGHEFVRFFHNQLGSILQDSLAKFEGRKMRECGEDLLVDLSEMLFNELAFFRLMQDLDEPQMKMSQQLRNYRQQHRDSVTSTDTATTQDNPETQDRLEGDSEAAQEQDTQTSATSSSSEMSDTETEDASKDADQEKEVDTAEVESTTNEEEDLGKARDDEFAAQVEISEREEDGDSEAPKSAVKIELAPSEIKSFTQIGSDEDDEGEDESISAEDPSETAVARDARIEDRLPQSIPVTVAEASDDADPENDSTLEQMEPEKDSTVEQPQVANDSAVEQSQAVPTQEEAGEGKVTENGQPQAEVGPPQNGGPSGDGPEANGETAQMNGEVKEEEQEGGEVTMDDLPVKLSGLSKETLAAQMSEEDAANQEALLATTVNSSPDSVLPAADGAETDGVIPDGSQLAGDPNAIKEPEAPVPTDQVRTV